MTATQYNWLQCAMVAQAAAKRSGDLAMREFWARQAVAFLVAGGLWE